MPKVMMIGKVSKLGRRTRKAGSFKGMLGTVVLEGSRAQSRRYGMGNIAGSPAEHAASLGQQYRMVQHFIQEAQDHKRHVPTGCSYVVSRASDALFHLGMMESDFRGADVASSRREPLAKKMRDMRKVATALLESCTASPGEQRKARQHAAVDAALVRARASKGVSGARRRR
jgi:hypothetical protein